MHDEERPQEVVEAALRESETKYRSLFEESIDVVYITARDGRLVDISPSAVSLFGYTREELIERDVHGLYADPEERRRFQEAIEKDGFVRGFEVTLLNRDGEEVNCLLTSTIRRAADGSTLGYQGIIRDITDRKRAERARDRERLAFRVLAEAAVQSRDMPDLCQKILNGLAAVLGFDGGTFRLHDAKRGMLVPVGVTGFGSQERRLVKCISIDSGSECVALHVANTGQAVFAPDVRAHDIFRSHSTRLNALGIRSAVSYPVYGSDRSLLAVVQLFGRSVHKLNEEEDRLFFETVAGVLGAVIERELAEEETRRVEAQLVQAQRMEAVGTLASGVAHDFNNLLTAIQGFAELALMSTEPGERLHEDLEKIRLAADRGAGLVRQLLLFGRNEHMQLGPVDINGTAVGIVRMLTPIIGEDVSVETHLDPGLWSAFADEGGVQQVLMNLAVNARDAMPDGGTLTIRTTNVTVKEGDASMGDDARPGDFICVQVTDSGRGMDEATIDRIFEPFFSTKGPGKGTGLGLSVVYGIVTQHGGWINATSKPHEGTTFEIYIPRAKDKQDKTTGQGNWRSAPEGTGERILVVEDEQSVRDLACTVLRKNGYKVFEASCFKEAVEVYDREGHQFALVFSDVVLPDKSGVHLADELLSEEPEQRLLLSSGHTDSRSQWNTISERGLPFIRKPYSVPELLKTVRRVLHQ